MPHQSLDHIRIVLVEPKQSGNIGAVARAMKNMGLSRLYLVNPGDHTSGTARAMAHGSGDILYGALVVDSLTRALEGTAFVVGTSHRQRREFSVICDPRTAAEHLLGLPEGTEGAIVFGREETGLTNAELQLCQMVSRAPSAVQYPSLNLSQAVLIYGYELYQASHTPVSPSKLHPAPHEEIEAMYAHILEALHKLGFVARHDPETFMRSIRRVLSRAPLERRDVATVHRIFRQVDRFIVRHGLNAGAPNDPESEKP